MIPAKYWSPTKKLMLLGAMAGGKLVEDTATGNPLTFITDVSEPLKSLLIPFTPKQSGTGDPSPENIRPILPWDGLTVYGGGKNLLDSDPSKAAYYNTEYSEGYYWNTATDTRESIQIFLVGYKGSTKIGNIRTSEYTTVGRKTMTFQITETYAEMDKLRITYNGKIRNFYVEYSLNLPLGSYVFSFDLVGVDSSTVGGFGFGNFQIEVGSSSSPVPSYEAPNITDTDIVFPSPVYGGTLDVVSGVMMKEFVSVDLGEQTWRKRSENQSRQIWEAYFNEAKFGGTSQSISANAYCSEFSLTTSNGAWTPGKFAPALEAKDKVFIFSVPAGSYASESECKEAMAGIQLVYELVTPQEIQLTPAQITALIGDNTIWSDADGSMTAVYLKKG